jgi:peroxiredoxin Q/BCP
MTLSTMKRTLCLSLLAVLCAALPASAAPAVGDPAPAFSLVGSDGKTYRLADFQGKRGVVIAWFPKAFTGGCTAECKSLRENGAAIAKTGVAVFAASTDDAPTNKKFAESLGLDYPILSDPTKDTAKAYGVLNPANGLASRWTFYIGKDGRIAHIDQAVQPSSHGQTVAEQAAKLGSK